MVKVKEQVVILIITHDSNTNNKRCRRLSHSRETGCNVVAGRVIGTHAHEVMSIVQHLMSHCDEEAGSPGKPVQVSLCMPIL